MVSGGGGGVLAGVAGLWSLSLSLQLLLWFLFACLSEAVLGFVAVAVLCDYCSCHCCCSSSSTSLLFSCVFR